MDYKRVQNRWVDTCIQMKLQLQTQALVDFKTGLESVSEDGTSSNGFLGTPNGSSHGKAQRGQVGSFSMELSAIRAR
jgi:hypothetical protein